jgi:pyoverdine/dityrosine biosynthesis protein Dit1
MSAIKPNPYVFPTKDFYDLHDRDVRWRSGDDGDRDLAYFIDLLSPFVEIAPPRASGGDAFETALSLLDSEEVRFGDSPFLQREHWVKLLKDGKQRGRIQFTIFGFPFKMPVPLKTDRFAPDAGELASLLRLNSLMFALEQILETPCELTIFAEEGFAKLVGVPEDEAFKYFEMVRIFAADPQLSRRIRVVAISEMESNPKYPELFEKNRQQNLKAYAAEAPDYMKGFDGAQPSFYRVLNTRGVDESTLAEVYSDDQDSQISKKALKVRTGIREAIGPAIAAYFGYLKTRDDLDYIAEVVPHAVQLSVSPKPYRLGVQPVHKDIEILPYHGVPVWSRSTFTIKYLYDLKREDKYFKKLGLSSDIDGAGAFLYVQE